MGILKCCAVKAKWISLIVAILCCWHHAAACSEEEAAGVPRLAPLKHSRFAVLIARWNQQLDHLRICIYVYVYIIYSRDIPRYPRMFLQVNI